MTIRLLHQVTLLFLAVGTAQASSTLIFPRLSFGPRDLIGIAIVYPGEGVVDVTFTAYGDSGQLLAGAGFTNPAVRQIRGGEQLSEVTSSIFGFGIDPATIGWIEATSEADDLTGFFQVLDFDISFLDGADLPQTAPRLIFQDVRLDAGFSTTAFLVNPGVAGTSVELSLVTGDSVKTKSLEIARKGTVEVDVAEFFEGVQPAGGGVASEAYLIASSVLDIAGFELVGREGEDLLGLNVRAATELLTTLLFPQLAVLGPFITEAVVGNFSEEAAIVTMTVYQGNGQIYTDEVQTNPVVIALDPGEISRSDLEQTFGFTGNSTLEGWLKVESTSAAINGSISYSIPSLGPIASVSSVREGSRRALISHIGTTLGFFTGLATLNAGALAANVRVVASMKDSQVLGTFTTTLQPGERRTDLLSNIIPEAAGQAGGTIWVESDVPVYLTAIFGSLETGVFANVPPQPVPESFQPDEGIPQLEVRPSLAVLIPGQVQQFDLTVAAGGVGPTQWGVNGVAGGSAEAGTISGAGLYTAPAVLPMTQPVTITAATDSQTVGASVDVQTKTLVFGGLGIVQSVAYLAGLERLYTSELSFGAAPAGRRGTQGLEQSTIFDVTTGTQQMVSAFSDDIPKMIPYRGVDGREYLLLAGRNSGTVRRLDPQTQGSVEVATGLNAPNALVLDTSGDVLAAEADKVSVITASQINQDLNPLQVEGPSGARQIATDLAPTGIAVDQCTGDVYISQASTGEVLVIDRQTGEITVVASGLSGPTQMLALYRTDISCPDSLHLLVIEAGISPLTGPIQSQVTLIVPGTGLVSPWAAATRARDIIVLPADNPLGLPTVLIAEMPEEGALTEVPLQGRYEPPPNPPKLNECIAIVNVPDTNLKGAIRESIPAQGPQGFTDPITCQVAQTLEVLFASFRDIQSLEGLEAFINLQEAFFFVNSISDAGPLAGLTRLFHVDLGDNLLTNLDPLAGLIRMQRLYLDDNFFDDTGQSPGAGTQGEGQPASQFPPVLGPLSNMPHLEFLLLDRNTIVDLSPLAGASHMGVFNAALNQINDISVVQAWPHLFDFRVGGNPIVDPTPVAGATGLEILGMQALGLTSIDFLAPLTSLEQLGLDDNDITDIDVVANFSNMTQLDISGNTPDDFTAIGTLPFLEVLDLFNTGLPPGKVPSSSGPAGNGELDFLSGLTQLQILSLAVNQIQNLGPLSGLINLNTLFLHSNLIADISALVANSGLGENDLIDVRDNELTAEDCADIQILRDHGATVDENVPCLLAPAVP